MKIREIMESGGTVSGGIAAVAMPMGMTSRSGGSMLSGKYVTSSDPTPNTPKEYKRNRHRASGQFKNSISN